MAEWIAPLRRRGLIQDTTPLPEHPHLVGAAYVGIDPTANSLHIGHLVPLQILYHLRQVGIQPIIVVGGATARIGDPSGKKSERPLLPPEQVAENARQLALQLQKLLPFPFTLVDNFSWLGSFSLLDFLREVGKYITVSYLLAKETVSSRLESGISFTEFSYPLLQAYDFYYLYQHYGCKLQIGGADQWGNITTGIELIRKLTGAETYGITAPLLTKADGTKFGKTEGGENIWLDAQRTSPYRFYQFWIQQTDADIERLLPIFSWKAEEEIAGLLERHRAAPDKRIAQRALAWEMTERIHGEETAQAVEQISAVIFGEGSLELLEKVAESFFRQIVEEMPHFITPTAEVSVTEVLAQSGFVSSKSEVRRLIQQGGIAINRQRIQEGELLLKTIAPLRERYWLLQRGKKHYAWLVLRD
ncbi:MAG: tyrosine--tRNA ligase [Bacteroidia bacterium]|nr:tyrosine--tRNA ligase [Bacteroidia bacterium]